MEQKNYLRIVWILAFIAFAAVSCWATAESLHLLLSTWPTIMCWIVTIGFFIIASMGTKMIVDSLNTNIYLEKRGLRLIGGFILLIIFWLICSMPTNTHTFFYRTVINDKVTTDISTTKGYLGQVINNTKNEEQASRKIEALRNEVSIKLGELEAEIKNEANPGFGPKSQSILRDLAKLLSVAKIVPLTFSSNSKQGRETLCDSYRDKIKTLQKTAEENIKDNILRPNPSNLQEVKTIDANLSLVKDYIADGTINLNNPVDVTGTNGVCDKLNEGYNAIKKNKDFVNFGSTEEEEIYTASNPVTKVKRLVSVFDVWKDFLKGEYKGQGFAFWIIVSILVDVAAFIFFDLAFRRKED